MPARQVFWLTARGERRRLPARIIVQWLRGDHSGRIQQRPCAGISPASLFILRFENESLEPCGMKTIPVVARWNNSFRHFLPSARFLAKNWLSRWAHRSAITPPTTRAR